MGAGVSITQASLSPGAERNSLTQQVAPAGA